MQEQFEQKHIFNLLSEMSIKMTSILDTDQLITYFVSSIAQIFKADRVSFMLLDQAKKQLFIKASHGLSISEDGSKMKLGEMFGGWVAKQGEPLLVKDKIPKIGIDVVDEGLKVVGKIFDIIGPTSSPYIVVRPKITDPQRLIGKKLYMILSRKKRRKR